MNKAMCEKWCEEHNATLIEVGRYGFSYMVYTGDIWWMPFSEMF